MFCLVSKSLDDMPRSNADRIFLDMPSTPPCIFRAFISCLLVIDASSSGLIENPAFMISSVSWYSFLLAPSMKVIAAFCT
uniref:Uncharacterized protein n=1 Tax=Arundo donax TaxID=35708 RepID=A0A0A9FBG6_ARUDO